MAARLDSTILKVFPNLNDFMILWQLLQVFAPIFSTSLPPATVLFTLPVSTDICILFATSSISPLFLLKKKEGSPSADASWQRSLTAIRAILIYSSWGSDPRTSSAWAVIEVESDQAITCLGDVQDTFRCYRKQCQQFCNLYGFFFPHLNQTGMINAMGRTEILSRHSFDYQTCQDLPQSLVAGWGVQGHASAHFTIQGLLTFLFFLFSVQKARETP